MVFITMLRVCALLLWFNVIFGIADGFSVPENSFTCVIGGGYSGLAAARYLKQFGLNFTVLERTRAIGSTWRFDPHIGVDEDGVPVSTSQYKDLKTSSPRHTMEYNGFRFPENTRSYVSGTCFYKYIKSFVYHFDLMTNIQLCSYVKSVKRKANVWELTYYQTKSKKNYTVLCDYVVVATGQNNKPYSAKIAGLNNFKGKIIHSHDYKSPDPFKDRKVLIVGAGPSGLDISVKLHKIAKKLIHSHHFVYNEPKFSERYVRKTDIKEVVYNGAIFNDLSFEELDDVIIATGFRLEHPFLEETSGLFLTDIFVLPLYNQIVNIRQPSMMFVGISKHTINKVLDAQAEYVSLLISGKFELPTQEVMLERWLKEYSSRKLKEANTIYENVLVLAKLKLYLKNLTQEAGITTVPPVLVDVILESNKNLKQDLFHYRDYEFEIIDSLRFTSRLFPNITRSSTEECPFEDKIYKRTYFTYKNNIRTHMLSK